MADDDKFETVFRRVHALTLLDSVLDVSIEQVQAHIAAADDGYLPRLTSRPEGADTEQAGDNSLHGDYLAAAERRASEQLEAERQDEAATWPAAGRTPFEADWWAAAGEAAAACLRDEHGVTVTTEADGSVRLCRDGAALARRQAAALRAQVESALLAPGLFDYGRLVSALLAAIVRSMKRRAGDFFPVAALDGVYGVETVPMNEAWSAPYDIAFEGASDHGNAVAYPNANNFQSTQIAYWHSIARKPHRVYLDFWARCLKAVSHEVVHCMQSKHGQIDNQPLSWSAEFDASYLAGSLLVDAARDPLFAAAMPAAWWPWLLLDWSRELHHQYYQYQGYTQQQYLRWRDAFGLVPPASDFAAIRPGAFYYAKNCVSFEALSYHDQHIQAQIEACFKQRTGDVYACSIVNLDQVKINVTIPQLLVNGFSGSL